MREEKKAHAICPREENKIKDDEYEMRRQIRKPWLYETNTPISGSPDINYRRTILDYDEAI